MKINKNPEQIYNTIGEVTKKLNLIDQKTGNIQTHTLRYWESQFKQLKPSIRAGNRRYYSSKDFQIIKFIKFLLKEKGFTINGVKKILNNIKTHSIDDNMNLGIYNDNLKNTKLIKSKIKKIAKIINDLKQYK